MPVWNPFRALENRAELERELRDKSRTLTTVAQALNTFLESGDWSAASRHLLTSVLRQTQSECGFLGVVLDGPVLRVLAHEGDVWDKVLKRDLYEAKMRQFAESDFFEVPLHENLLGEAILKGRTIATNHPSADPSAKGVPEGHPMLNSFLGVPIFKGSETVGLIGVANRPGGYTGDELRSLELMSQATGVLYDNYRQSVKHSQLEERRALLEAEFRQAQKMEVLGQLAGGVAHDFNNMLMVLSSSAELLERTLLKNSEAAPYIEQILRTTEKAAVITKQLLAFSRKQVLDVKPTDLHEVLTECEFMLPRLLGSDVELTFEHQAERSWIEADAAQIEQIVANLAINARDAMASGGKLTISTRNAASLPKDASQVTGSSETSGWVVLEVADTGSGMDQKTRSHVFEPFFTTKPQGKGTGLGLSTVYGIVHQLGGSIYMESQPGVGTSFQLFFPLHGPPAAVPTPSLQATVPKAESKEITVLLADDEAALRGAIAEYLRTTGQNVLESHSSHDALEQARSYPGQIDVLLTDIVMPGLRGPDLAKQVSELRPGIHVIYISGYAEGLPEAQVPPGAVFLQKPFRFSMLGEQLKLMPRKQ